VALWLIKESVRYLLEFEMRADPARMNSEMWWPRVAPYITVYQVNHFKRKREPLMERQRGRLSTTRDKKNGCLAGDVTLQ
jgi:hypothetical protein